MADERGTPPTPGDGGHGGAGEAAGWEIAIHVIFLGALAAGEMSDFSDKVLFTIWKTLVPKSTCS